MDPPQVGTYACPAGKPEWGERDAVKNAPASNFYSKTLHNLDPGHATCFLAIVVLQLPACPDRIKQSYSSPAVDTITPSVPATFSLSATQKTTYPKSITLLGHLG